MMRALGKMHVLAAAAWTLAGTAHAAATVKASSEGTDDEGQRHGAVLAFDGDLQTAWSEGEEGDGVGTWIEVRFDKPVDVRTISMWSGDLRKGARTARESARPKLVTVTLTTADGPVTVQDAVPDVREGALRRKDIAIEGTATAVRVTIDEVFPGFITSDCYVAELAVNFAEPPSAPIAKLQEWMASDAGLKLADKHREEVVARFDEVDQSELGSRDALLALMDWAANGAPWVADRARKEIPYGFRVQAIPPDETAIEALLKLRDANAIPALTMAALRMQGKDAAKLMSQVGYFEAWVELQLPRRNLPVWGKTGFEKGGLKGREEPLAVALSEYGDVYVADVGNHRITVFNQDGSVRATWGIGKPNVTNLWLGTKDTWYAAGREPSEEAGGFVNPLDLALVSTKGTEQLVVLDATGRVQWLDGQGAVQRTLSVPLPRKLKARRGGAGHLLLLKGRTAVVWGDELVAVDDAGEEVARWTIEDGPPLSAAVLPNGKLLFGYADGIVMYSPDGFRHGTMLTADKLPRGFEDYDITLDEKNKVWLVTDNGHAVKLKGLTKVDFDVVWSDVAVDTPRMAVRDGMLFISGGDSVRRVDALELKARAEEGDE